VVANSSNSDCSPEVGPKSGPTLWVLPRLRRMPCGDGGVGPAGWALGAEASVGGPDRQHLGGRRGMLLLCLP
jgi:hypothetical protein